MKISRRIMLCVKRKILIILLALVAVLSCSCGQKEQQLELPTYERITESQLEYGEIETGTVAGDYIYRSIGTGFLIKYHIPTGTAATVCQDPYCEHGQRSCPFWVIPQKLASIGNILYYAVKQEDRWHLRSYDGDSMQVKEIRTSNGVLGGLFSYNYYLYFTETYYTENEGQTKSTIYRWDTQTDAFDVIDCGHPYATIDSIVVGRIIWKVSDHLISTDLAGDDARAYTNILQREWGKYMFRWEVVWTASDYYYSEIYRKDLETNEEILIAENIEEFYMYGDKILYLYRSDSPRLVTTEAGTIVKDFYGGDVYIMNFDGSNKHLLCHVDDFYYFYTSYERNNEYVCGDWVGMHSQNSYLKENGSSMLDLTDMLFVNVVTEEYKLIKFNPYE